MSSSKFNTGSAMAEFSSSCIKHKFWRGLKQTWIWPWPEFELDNKLFTGVIYRRWHLLDPRNCRWGSRRHSFFSVNSWWEHLFINKFFVSMFTSSLNFLISTERSSQWRVYCHLAVFSDSTTWRRWRCFCSSSSFWRSSLLKLENVIFCISIFGYNRK